MSNEFNSSAVSSKGKIACYEFSFEEFPDTFDMHPFTDSDISLETGIAFSLYGGLPLICLVAENCCYQIPKFDIN